MRGSNSIPFRSVFHSLTREERNPTLIERVGVEESNVTSADEVLKTGPPVKENMVFLFS